DLSQDAQERGFQRVGLQSRAYGVPVECRYRGSFQEGSGMKLLSRFAVNGVALGGLVLATAATATAADEKATYYEHVARILQANCVSCHKPAGKNIGSLVAPMSLTTYEEVRPWARAIARK